MKDTMADEQTNLAVQELLENSDQSWIVEKRPLFDENQTPTGSWGLFRKDKNLWLSTVGDRFTIMQNWELAQIVISAGTQLGLKTTRGGILANGVRVYLQLDLPDQYIGKSNVKRLLSWLNFHGGGSLAAGSTNTVVVCENTFHRAYMEMPKFRHTTSLKERVELAKNNMIVALKEEEKVVNNFKLMADMEIGDHTPKLVKSIFGVDVDKMKADVSTRKLNQIRDFIESVKISISEQGDNLWALYNGVTRYTNHVAAPDDGADRLSYLMTGGGSVISTIGYNELMKIVNENLEKVSVAV
jgi:hypothetical protein